MHKFRAAIGRLRRDCHGNVALVVALNLPLIAGGAALGVETGYWYYDHVRLQQAADAAAYAAAVEDRAGSTNTAISSAALAAATANGFSSITDTLALNTPPTSGPNQNDNSVEVVLARSEQRFLSQIFSSAAVTIRARSVATFTTAANACILALDKSASRAVQFSGSSSVTLAGCNVMSNSIATESIYSQGASMLTVPCLMSAGGVSINASVTQTECEAAMTELPLVADPFKDLPEPTPTGGCRNSGGATLQPGRYCNGLNLSGTKTLQPGVYIIEGGTFRANGSAEISGSGVTFVLTDSADLSFNGNATLNLSAPTSGPYAGVLFFGSRTNSSSAGISFNGTAGSALTGALYFPSQPVAFSGDMEGANGCTQLVAKTVDWSGNASLAVDCTSYGMSALAVGGVVKLAE